MDIMNLFLWSALACYSSSFIPQLVTNFKHRSTAGLSDLFLLLYSIAYLSMQYYVFCLDLPLAYKVMVPFEASLNVLLVSQRFYYHRFAWNNFFSLGIVISCVVSLLALPWAIYNPLQAGQFFGWVATIVFSVNQLPQIVKLYRSKTTHGFSFWFVSFIALAMALELVGGLAKELPLQTIVMAVRGIVVYCVFCVQFWLYRKKDQNCLNVEPNI